MRRVDWTARSLDDLNDIVAYIQDRNLLAAENIRLMIEAGANRAGLNPFAYRSGRVAGTREAVVHPNYVVIFSVTEEAVEIRAVLHARQQYP